MTALWRQCTDDFSVVCIREQLHRLTAAKRSAEKKNSFNSCALNGLPHNGIEEQGDNQRRLIVTASLCQIHQRFTLHSKHFHNSRGLALFS